jgi:hypothetical protein
MGQAMGWGRAPERQPGLNSNLEVVNAIRRTPVFDQKALFAFAIYLALSISLFGRALFGHFGTVYIGVGPDPALMMWSLVWWPHAAINRINPFLTDVVFAPTGLNLTWQTTIPFASAVASPLTLTAGPVAAYNVLCLAALTFDAWCAFILCRYLSRSFWPSCIGGFVFGFSAFFLGHLVFGDLHMLVAPALPLIVYVAARRLAGDIAQRRFVLMLTVLLTAQFLQSLEIFATTTMCGAIALVLGYAVTPRDAERKNISSLLRPVIASYVLTFAIVSPYLYYFIGFGFTSKPVWPPSYFNTDLLNFVIPTRTNQVGRLSQLAAISTKFPGGSIAENGSYLGLPLILVAVLFVRQRRQQPAAKLLIYFLLVICVLSFGPALHVAGRAIVAYMPWRLLELPVLRNAMPVRLSVYAFLDLAIIASLWLASTETNSILKATLVALLIVFNVPNLSARFWSSKVDTPAFFQDGAYRRYLSKGETALILPYGQNGNAMLWQAQTDMYFRMPEGGAGVRMEESRRWPIVTALERRSYVPQAAHQLRMFLGAHGVSAIVVADDDIAIWQPLLAQLGAPAIKSGDVSLYRVAVSTPSPSADVLLKARTRFDEERIRTLVLGVQEYLSKGGNPALLSAAAAPDLGIIPRKSLIGPAHVFDPSVAAEEKAPDPRLAFGVWLGPWPGGRVSVGEYAWYPAIRDLMDRIRPIATAVYFVDPSAASPGAPLPSAHDQGVLLMVFTREQLVRAAALLAAESKPAAQ